MLELEKNEAVFLKKHLNNRVKHAEALIETLNSKAFEARATDNNDLYNRFVMESIGMTDYRDKLLELYTKLVIL